jgi:hypothetical protein
MVRLTRGMSGGVSQFRLEPNVDEEGAYRSYVRTRLNSNPPSDFGGWAQPEGGFAFFVTVRPRFWGIRHSQLLRVVSKHFSAPYFFVFWLP